MQSGGGGYATAKKRSWIIGEGGGVVDLYRRLIKKRRSGVIVAKETYGEGGGVVDANCYCKGVYAGYR